MTLGEMGCWFLGFAVLGANFGAVTARYGFGQSFTNRLGATRRINARNVFTAFGVPCMFDIDPRLCVSESPGLFRDIVFFFGRSKNISRIFEKSAIGFPGARIVFVGFVIHMGRV